MLVSKLVALSLLMPVQYSVPTECTVLAQREGFKADLDEKEAKRANRRLKWLRLAHPFNSEIKECGRAVDRMKAYLQP